MDNGDDDGGDDDERDGGDSCWYFNKLNMSSVSLILFKGMMSSRKLLDVCTNKDDDDCVLVDCV